MQYDSLNNAAENPSVEPRHQEMLRAPQDAEGPRVEVWYAANPDFLGEGPFLPEGEPGLPPTHIRLGAVEYRRDWQTLFGPLQGDFWSPNGEANDLIVNLGLRHTSMSVGDVLVVHHPDRTEKWMCASTGWREV